MNCVLSSDWTWGRLDGAWGWWTGEAMSCRQRTMWIYPLTWTQVPAACLLVDVLGHVTAIKNRAEKTEVEGGTGLDLNKDLDSSPFLPLVP